VANNDRSIAAAVARKLDRQATKSSNIETEVKNKNDAMKAYIVLLFNDRNESENKVRIHTAHNTAISTTTVPSTNATAPSTLQSILWRVKNSSKWQVPASQANCASLERRDEVTQPEANHPPDPGEKHIENLPHNCLKALICSANLSSNGRPTTTQDDQHHYTRTELDSLILRSNCFILSDTIRMVDTNPFTPDDESMIVNIMDAAIE